MGRFLLVEAERCRRRVRLFLDIDGLDGWFRVESFYCIAFTTLLTTHDIIIVTSIDGVELEISKNIALINHPQWLLRQIVQNIKNMAQVPLPLQRGDHSFSLKTISFPSNNQRYTKTQPNPSPSTLSPRSASVMRKLIVNFHL